MLIPREHGAYGQLLFPLLSALLIGSPSAGAYLLAASAVAAFLAHEALLVVLGQRGMRAAREEGADARRSLALFGGFCAVTGTVSVAVMSFDALSCLLVPLALGALVAVAVFTHRERSTPGEMLAAVALSSVSLPVAIAGALPHIRAVTLFIVFAAVFVTATVAVRAMIGRVSKRGRTAPGRGRGPHAGDSGGPRRCRAGRASCVRGAIRGPAGLRRLPGPLRAATFTKTPPIDRMDLGRHHGIDGRDSGCGPQVSG